MRSPRSAPPLLRFEGSIALGYPIGTLGSLREPGYFADLFEITPRVAGLPERQNFGVIEASIGVKAPADNFAVAHYHRAHHGVGTRQPAPLACEVERFAHENGVH